MNKREFERELNEALSKGNYAGIRDVIGGINSLPHYIDGDGDCVYMPFVIRTDHEISFPDSYIALYGRRTENGLSTKNYLFLVASSSATEVLKKFLFAYRELVKQKLIRDDQWICPYHGFKLMVSEKDLEGSKLLRDL